MLDVIFQNSSGNSSLKKYTKQVKKINSLEQKLESLSASELKSRTLYFKERISAGKPFNDFTCEAFAIVREATKRVLKIRPFDVQLIGGLVLNEGKIAEMKTGEGKTIVAMFPVYLNALSGRGVQIITVNDYLARRDAEYVGQVYRFLGLTVGLIQENMEPQERKDNYNCDVVFVTNNELGFDYLRDNMALTKEEIVQRPFSYCVVDEVDSILIDEARSPLIISGAGDTSTEKYSQSTKLTEILKKDVHYLVDEKNQNINLLEEGVNLCEQALKVSDLYNIENPWIPYILNSIKAKELFKLNTHYVINQEKEIVIVDEFTGRVMVGRRWSDGLHQAVEAKENLPVKDESQTLASITYQNLFLLYDKLSGMTGTAKTEELEFEKIYNLKVISIPTNRPIQRKDFPDLVYKNQYLKWKAVANECCDMHSIKRPVLVGTTTIEKSELLASLLSEYNISYRLLNARPENIEKESEIIAQAGCKGAITISTNMAGRGTDINLGGNIESLFKSKIINVLSDYSDYQSFITKISDDVDLKVFLPFFNGLENGWLSQPANIKFLLTAISSGKDLPSINASFPAQKFRTIYFDFLYHKKKRQERDRKDVIGLGGLHVIGTERHESRRIDNQLRGRSGRQGDIGSSQFFLSLDDKLLRLFGGDKILDILKNIGLQDDKPIQSPFLNKSLETAQKKVEDYYSDIRKQLFEYDEALTSQRNGIYAERKRIIENDNLRDWIIEYGERSLYDIALARQNVGFNDSDFFYISKIQELLGFPYNFYLDNNDPAGLDLSFLRLQFQITYDLKELQLESIEKGLLRELEKSFLLQQIDYAWKENLQKIAFFRDSIRWRAYGQKNPLTDYKQESYNFFIIMLTRIRHRVIYFVLRSKILLDF